MTKLVTIAAALAFAAASVIQIGPNMAGGTGFEAPEPTASCWHWQWPFGKKCQN